jgi:hypothetical protein
MHQHNLAQLIPQSPCLPPSLLSFRSLTRQRSGRMALFSVASFSPENQLALVLYAAKFLKSANNQTRQPFTLHECNSDAIFDALLMLPQVLQNYYWNKRNYTAVTLGKANAMTVVPNQYGYVICVAPETFPSSPLLQRNAAAPIAGAGSCLRADLSDLPWLHFRELRTVLRSCVRSAYRSLLMSQLRGALSSAEWSEGTGELQCFGVGAMNMVRLFRDHHAPLKRELKSRA